MIWRTAASLGVRVEKAGLRLLTSACYCAPFSPLAHEVRRYALQIDESNDLARETLC